MDRDDLQLRELKDEFERSTLPLMKRGVGGKLLPPEKPSIKRSQATIAATSFRVGVGIFITGVLLTTKMGVDGGTMFIATMTIPFIVILGGFHLETRLFERKAKRFERYQTLCFEYEYRRAALLSQQENAAVPLVMPDIPVRSVNQENIVIRCKACRKLNEDEHAYCVFCGEQIRR